MNTPLAAPAGEGLTGLAGWVVDVIAAMGVWGVGAMTLLEVVFPPIPSEVVLPLAGFLAGRGRMSLWGAFTLATAGALLGAVVLYAVGLTVGPERLGRVLRKVPLLAEEDLERARAWFRRHGRSAVFVGRFVPGVRSIVSVPAGSERMPLGQFLLYTLLGSAMWNAALMGVGFALGDRWQSIGDYSTYLNVAVGAALALITARFAWNRRHRIARGRR